MHSAMVFNGIAKICLIADFDHFSIVLGDLGSQRDLPEFNSPSFTWLVEEFGGFFYKNMYEQLANAKWVCLSFWLPKPYFST
jgi:hypothetical protein